MNSVHNNDLDKFLIKNLLFSNPESNTKENLPFSQTAHPAGHLITQSNLYRS
jgi:hypothetical protein